MSLEKKPQTISRVEDDETALKTGLGINKFMMHIIHAKEAIKTSMQYISYCKNHQTCNLLSGQMESMLLTM